MTVSREEFLAVFPTSADYERALIREGVPYLRGGAYVDPSAPVWPKLSNGVELRQGIDYLRAAGVPIKD
jgi:hypothetical protein